MEYEDKIQINRIERKIDLLFELLTGDENEGNDGIRTRERSEN